MYLFSQVALYSRKELGIRTTSNFLLALSANFDSTRQYLKKYFCASIALPSDWIEVAQIFKVILFFHKISVLFMHSNPFWLCKSWDKNKYSTISCYIYQTVDHIGGSLKALVKQMSMFCTHLQAVFLLTLYVCLWIFKKCTGLFLLSFLHIEFSVFFHALKKSAYCTNLQLSL